MTDNFTTLTKRLDSLNARFDAMVARLAAPRKRAA